MTHQMIPKALLDELVKQAQTAPVINIAEIAERRAPVVIELETDAELAMKGNGVEIKHDGQIIVLSSAVLDYIDIYRRSQKCGRAS